MEVEQEIGMEMSLVRLPLFPNNSLNFSTFSPNSQFFPIRPFPLKFIWKQNCNISKRVYIATGLYRNGFISKRVYIEDVIDRKFFDIHPFRYFPAVLLLKGYWVGDSIVCSNIKCSIRSELPSIETIVKN